MKHINKYNVLSYESNPNHSVFVSSEILPISETIPEWYKLTPRWVEIEGQQQPGLKHCAPFLDGLTLGYTIVLSENIYVEQTPDGPVIRWKEENEYLPPIFSRPISTIKNMPIPPDCHDEYFLFNIRLAIEMPDGYSLFYTHPINRWELPFITIGAVVDDYKMYELVLPFFIRKGFEGEILAGTPLTQIIPFLRENWEAKKVKGLYEKAKLIQPSNTVKINEAWYKKNIWKRKTYK